ncbi:MAG: glycoside hydrolase family 1 protein [Candidatus Omnitrophica bacterium]|nr:glycoside hydrolase family 1 protein [Candidatus Omnitrophota bacterium]MDD5538046.1 glycoside hydrolase family 1 protein [Candidatus Omnitrophota bacterium]
MMKFPKDFLWGSALSAYQAEGDNKFSDWWSWEIETGKERSGRACRHYEFYEQDFELAGSLNHNAHRLSIEWGRIEPQEGNFSEEGLNHYLGVIASLKKRHIEPIVTLHHFTNPAWLSRRGGWEKKGSVDAYLRYCRFVVRALAGQVHYWVTINEPTVYVSHAYIFGVWPPQARSYLKAKIVGDNLASAHIRAYRLIHDLYGELSLPGPSVGLAQYTQAFYPCTQSLKDRLAAGLRDRWFNFGFLDKLARHHALDFIGMNYYSRQVVELKKWGWSHWAMDVCEKNHHPAMKNSLGWDIYPEGLSALLLKLKKYNLPVIITENGICTEDDRQRWEYIYRHLEHIHFAIEKGVPVVGYLYWSLLDNFEWDKGFSPKFGLIGIDYDTYERSVRESARKFAAVCKTGVLE